MVGQFVLSIAGRDKGRMYVVIRVLDDNYVLVTDGKTRKIDKPKKKKIKHIKLLDGKAAEIADIVMCDEAGNALVMSWLAQYKTDHAIDLKRFI